MLKQLLLPQLQTDEQNNVIFQQDCVVCCIGFFMCVTSLTEMSVQNACVMCIHCLVPKHELGRSDPLGGGGYITNLVCAECPRYIRYQMDKIAAVLDQITPKMMDKT
jgi:hypothetical protein